MSRKTKKDKEITKLRREVEALRAQASKKHKNIKTLKQNDEKVTEKDAATDVADVRNDLRKTAVLTAVCLVILFALTLTGPRWSVLF